jgi:DNA-binding NtrC family response regulator
MTKLLLVEDDPALQFTIQTALEANGYEVDAAPTTGEVIERLGGQAYPISDIYIDERAGLDILHAAKRRDPLCAVILMTGRGTIETTWPGNVRQLQHVIERLTVLADRIDAEAVRAALTIMESREKPVDTLADAEEDQIRRVLSATGGNKSKAAQLLGIERKTLYRKLERMKL